MKSLSATICYMLVLFAIASAKVERCYTCNSYDTACAGPFEDESLSQECPTTEEYICMKVETKMKLPVEIHIETEIDLETAINVGEKIIDKYKKSKNKKNNTRENKIKRRHLRSLFGRIYKHDRSCFLESEVKAYCDTLTTYADDTVASITCSICKTNNCNSGTVHRVSTLLLGIILFVYYISK